MFTTVVVSNKCQLDVGQVLGCPKVGDAQNQQSQWFAGSYVLAHVPARILPHTVIPLHRTFSSKNADTTPLVDSALWQLFVATR